MYNRPSATKKKKKDLDKVPAMKWQWTRSSAFKALHLHSRPCSVPAFLHIWFYQLELLNSVPRLRLVDLSHEPLPIKPFSHSAFLHKPSVCTSTAPLSAPPTHHWVLSLHGSLRFALSMPQGYTADLFFGTKGQLRSETSSLLGTPELCAQNKKKERSGPYAC